MNQEIEKYIEKYPQEIVLLFSNLRDIVMSADKNNVEEKMWAKLPSYYCGEKFIRLIPFKDHINIEAAGLFRYSEELSDSRFTPKGMLQIRIGDSINRGVLEKAFSDTFVK